MNESKLNSLMKAATERQLAVAALQKSYESCESLPTEQLVSDMRELLATERVVLDAIITLFAKLEHEGDEPSSYSPAHAGAARAGGVGIEPARSGRNP